MFVADAIQTGLNRIAAVAKAERVIIRLPRDFTGQGRRFNHAGGMILAPKVVASDLKIKGMTQRAFKPAMEFLLSRCEICIRSAGPPSQKQQFLGVLP